MDHKTVSIADQVFEMLEKDILVGVYARGEMLTEMKLSEHLGVSRTPIREALRRLEQERLVASTSRGVRVVGLNMRDIEDIYDIRVRIEALAARRAAERCSEEDLRALARVLELQEFYTQKDDSDNIIEADNRFHDMMYKLSGSQVLYDTLSPLHRKLIKYRKVSVRRSGRAAKSFAEHKALYAAIAAHDADLAEELLMRHINNAKESILSTEGE